MSHDDLDWAPLGTATTVTFRNLMTSHDDSLAAELTGVAAARIGAGEWPWSFYCFVEGRPRPVTPSAFAVIAPGGRSLGVAVRCPVVRVVSVNLVTREHVDLPFWNDGQSASWTRLRARRSAGSRDFRAELAVGDLRREETRSRALRAAPAGRGSLPPGIAGLRATADSRHMSAAVLTAIAPAGSIASPRGRERPRGARSEHAQARARPALRQSSGRDFADRLVTALSDKSHDPRRLVF